MRLLFLAVLQMHLRYLQASFSLTDQGFTVAAELR